jgi:hypothetical protein
MAKLHEEVIILKVTKLIKDTDEMSEPLVGDSLLSALEDVAAELIGQGAVIETERA